MSDGDPDGEPSGDPVIDRSGAAVAVPVSPAASDVAGVVLSVDDGWSRGGF